MKRFFLNWWTLTLLAAVLVALLLALGLPIFVALLRRGTQLSHPLE